MYTLSYELWNHCIGLFASPVAKVLIQWIGWLKLYLKLLYLIKEN